jgi:thiopeptide-type bacteriocin biosynthesis protein
MQRKFIIGSPWLYYKIYTGSKTSDSILEQQIYKFTQKLTKEKLISKWFFIRYNDPQPHIRVRFLMNDTQNLPYLIEGFYQLMNPLLQNETIWKIQTDTYNREIERYSEKLMEFSETLFCITSNITLLFIKEKKQYTPFQELLFGITFIHIFVKNFIQNSQQLELFYKDLYLNFKTEFLSNSQQNKELDAHFRLEKQQIIHTLHNPYDNFSYLKKLIPQLNKTQKTDTIYEVNQHILSSHTHMIINRLYNNNQRKYEFIIYDHLYRYFKFENNYLKKNA